MAREHEHLELSSKVNNLQITFWNRVWGPWYQYGRLTSTFVILLHQVRASYTSMEGGELCNHELDLS